MPSEHPINERIDELAKLKEDALHAGSEKAVAAPARAREAHRTRAHRQALRPRNLPRARHARPSPRARVRHRGEPAPHRRCDHWLGRDRRPQGVPVLAGLHDLRRRARRGVRREDPQGDGSRRVHRRAVHRSQRRRRRANPGRRRQPRRATAASSSATCRRAVSSRRSA